MKKILSCVLFATAVAMTEAANSKKLVQTTASQVTECTCDVDLLDDGGPFPSGGAGDGVLTGFGQGIAVSQSENIVTVPNEAY